MQQQQTPIKLLWFGFTGAVFVYILVAYMNLVQVQSNLDKSSLPPDYLFWGVIAISFVEIMVAKLVFGKLIISKLPQPVSPDRIVPLQLLQFAIYESIAIIGLVFFFVTGDFNRFLAVAAISLIMLVSSHPKTGFETN